MSETKGSGRTRITARDPAQRLRPSKKRKGSSARWLVRQLNDPYVAEAKRRGLRSRAAFKLTEIDDRFHLLRPGQRLIDLGAAPGGWTQVAIERVRAADGQGQVVAVDVTPVEPINGAILLCGDIRDAATVVAAKEQLGGPADVVLSDMAPPSTGHAATDHLRIVALLETALAFAEEVLAPGGTFVAKVWQGGAAADVMHRLKTVFARVRHAKPPASRPESAESYVVAEGFRGAPEGMKRPTSDAGD